MERMARKSTLGTHGVLPIRLNLSPRSKSPLGSGVSPRAIRLGATRRTLAPLGSSKTKRASPVRLGDLSTKDQSFFFSSKKKPKIKSPITVKTVSGKSRRCLYKDGEGNESSSATVKPKTVGRPAGRSNIPLPGTFSWNPNGLTKNKVVSMPGAPSSRNVTKTTKPCAVTTSKTNPSSMQSDSLNLILEQMKAVAAEQKAMLAEAKGIFGDVLQEQRNILHEMKQIQDAHHKLLQSHEFTSIEKNIENDCQPTSGSSETNFIAEEESSKENSICRPSRKSAVAYKEMRKSFRCLNTPTISAKKARTPRVKSARSSLSSKVKAQLECLLDD